MVVTNGIERALQYFHAVRDYLKERKSRYRAIVAFSGEHNFGGAQVSEASLNGFPARLIAEKIVMASMMKDDNQLFKQFMDNDGFRRWMTDTVFKLTAAEQVTAAQPNLDGAA